VTSADDLDEVLLIGGRSGVGKTSVAFEVSELLQVAGVAHCLIDGDNLDAAYPKAPEDTHGTTVTETNLQAMWATYRTIGHHRLVYVNTSSVLEAAMVTRAMGGRAHARGVLLTASEATVRTRLSAREPGSTLQRHLERSAAAAVLLDAEAPKWTVRVATDGRTVTEIADQVIATTPWLPPG